MSTVKDVFNYIDTFASFDMQCEWDNSGLLIGNEENTVKKAMVCLDLTPDALEKAKINGCELVITHHPVIFSPIKSISFNTVVSELCKNEISVICAHTNFDKANGGVNDILCDVLNLKNVTAFGNDGLARTGESEEPMSDAEFSRFVKNKLGCGAVKYTPTQRPIKKVAVCGGAGADYLYDCVNINADALVTADTKHHELLFAAQNGICLVDAGHYSTENPAIFVLAEKLTKEFNDIEFTVFEGCDPAEYIK